MTAPLAPRAALSIPPSWLQASAVAALWAGAAALGGLGTSIDARGAAAAAGLALVAAGLPDRVPTNLLLGVTPALLLAGATVGVMATGPAIAGTAAVVVTVVGLVAVAAGASRYGRAGALAVLPATALAARAAPGLDGATGWLPLVAAAAAAVVGLRRARLDATCSSVTVLLVSGGIAALARPPLVGVGLLLVVAGVLMLAVPRPWMVLAASPGAAMAVDVALTIPLSTADRGVLVALAILAGLAGVVLAADGGQMLPSTVDDIDPGWWITFAALVWLVAAPNTWGWIPLARPDAYVEAITRAMAGGLLAVAIAGLVRVSDGRPGRPTRRPQ
ncbi:MAG: hypothetical protein ACR2H3_06640 [Acidimicrobiales bacterium]